MIDLGASLYERPGRWVLTRVTFYASTAFIVAALFVLGSGIYATIDSDARPTPFEAAPAVFSETIEPAAPVVLPAADPADQVLVSGLGNVSVNKIAGASVDFEQMPYIDGKIEMVVRDVAGNNFVLLSLVRDQSWQSGDSVSNAASKGALGPFGSDKAKNGRVLVVPFDRFKLKATADGLHFAAQVDRATENQIAKTVKSSKPKS